MAENWIIELEKLFDAMDCEDTQRAHLAAFKMTGEAYDWWTGEKGNLMQDGPITWAKFVTAFNHQYFSYAE